MEQQNGYVLNIYVMDMNDKDKCIEELEVKVNDYKTQLEALHIMLKAKDTQIRMLISRQSRAIL